MREFPFIERKDCVVTTGSLAHETRLAAIVPGVSEYYDGHASEWKPLGGRGAVLFFTIASGRKKPGEVDDAVAEVIRAIEEIETEETAVLAYGTGKVRTYDAPGEFSQAWLDIAITR